MSKTANKTLDGRPFDLPSHLKLVPGSVRVCPSTRADKHTYAVMKERIWKDGQPTERDTFPLYDDEADEETRLAMRIAGICIGVIESACIRVYQEVQAGFRCPHCQRRPSTSVWHEGQEFLRCFYAHEWPAPGRKE